MYSPVLKEVTTKCVKCGSEIVLMTDLYKRSEDVKETCSKCSGMDGGNESVRNK